MVILGDILYHGAKNPFLKQSEVIALLNGFKID